MRCISVIVESEFCDEYMGPYLKSYNVLRNVQPIHDLTALKVNDEINFLEMTAASSSSAEFIVISIGVISNIVS